MTKQEIFLKRLKELHLNCVDISAAKNADYATDDDPFRNFTASSAFGIKPEVGIVVRMADKLSRVTNLLQRDAKVKDESILDTLSDLSNYALILRIMIEQKNGKG